VFLSRGRGGAAVPAIVAGGDPAGTELIVDGNIGSPVMRHWLVTIDIPHQRLWLAELP
jgi:hypothetical protein